MDFSQRSSTNKTTYMRRGHAWSTHFEIGWLQVRSLVHQQGRLGLVTILLPFLK